MADRGHVVWVPGERAESNSVAAQQCANHCTRNLQCRSEVFSEIAPVLGVLGTLAKDPERTRPPLHVMIARHHQQRGNRLQLLEKQVSRHEFTMAGSLSQVSRDDDGRWSEPGEICRQSLELIQIRVHAEVQV